MDRETADALSAKAPKKILTTLTVEPVVLDRFDALQRAGAFRYRTKDRASLQHVLFESGRAAASDGHRLALIPCDTAHWEGTCRSTKGEQTKYYFPSIQNIFDLFQGACYTEVLDARHLNRVLTAARSEEAVGLYVDYRKVCLHLRESDTMITLGESNTFSHQKACFNPKYLRDACKGAKGSVRITLSKNNTFLRIDREDGEIHFIAAMTA
jgi:hypothetical protein